MKQRIITKEIASLYNQLLLVTEIPIVETTEIHSKGFYASDNENTVIYIKASLPVKEKLLVALHETSHYIHLTKYIENESRAECELIAQCTTFFVLKELNLAILNEVNLSKAIDNSARLHFLSNKIQQISQEILHLLRTSKSS